MKIILSVSLTIAIIIIVSLGISAIGTRSEINSLKSQVEQYQAVLTDVNNKYQTAQAEITGLQNDIKDSEIQLNETLDELTDAEAELARTKFELKSVNRRLDAASSENEHMLDSYTSLRTQIYQKLGIEEDSKAFITPDDPAVAAKAKAIAGDYSEDTNEFWRDYKRLYDWVVNNIEYNADSKIPVLPVSLDGEINWHPEYWRTPSETLEDLAGDCEDMANLLASLMLSYNNQGFAVWLVEIHNDDSGHLAVAFPVAGGKLTILDPAGYYYTGYYTGTLQSERISTAVNNWLIHWADEMPGAEVTAAFSYNFYEEFSKAQTFIQWAMDR